MNLSLAFEQLQQSATRRLVASRTLGEALAYLRVSLHGVLLETLRAHKRSETVSGRVKGLLPLASPQEFWEWVQRLLPDDREQRLFYLLYLGRPQACRDSCFVSTGVERCPGGHSSAGKYSETATGSSATGCGISSSNLLVSDHLERQPTFG